MTIQLPDVSHYNGAINLAGSPAIKAKATEGSSYIDPTYATHKAQAAALGVPFQAYHWINTADLAAQAAHAYAVVGSTPLMWDAEALGVTVPRLVELTQRLRDLGGNPRSFYLPAWWWHDHMGAPDLRPIERLGLYLVSSNYPSGGYSEHGAGWIDYGNVSPTEWQWKPSAPGNNAFRGTVDDLRRLWGLEDDMPLTPQDLAAIKSTVWYSDLDTGARDISAGSALLGVYDRPPAAPPSQEQIDAAVKAALLDPAVLAAIAAAVNNEAAARLAD